jgi:cobalamin-dependent methionine synthase I
MTLKEKLSQYAKQEVWEKKNYNAEECEAIADDFAIGFAEWLLHLYKTDQWETFSSNTNEKLLQIYKQEKGL